MAESIVKVPQDVASDKDFLAFSFNGKHSWDDFGIYRTSGGDRYNENLAPTLSDKTAEVPGGDGMYYFGTTHKQKDFNISFAFDCLTEQKLQEMKKWLNGKEMGDLWFQEAPYKVWTAKPTGNSSIKYIPFDEQDEKGNKIRVYKGEGTVQFTAYWPYAHTPDYVEYGWFFARAEEFYVLPFSTNYGLYCEIEKANSSATLTIYNSNKRRIGSIGFTSSSGNITLSGTPVYASVNTDSYILIREYSRQSAEHTPIRGNGKKLSSYVGFCNKDEWATTSKLTDSTGTCTGENPGDLPAPFIVTWSGPCDEDKTYQIGDLSITTKEATNNLQWDSKTGIVSGIDVNDNKRKPINYIGSSLGSIPNGGVLASDVKLEDGSLSYHYWYY